MYIGESNMIEVKQKQYDDRYPEWVNMCPHCNINYADITIQITSDYVNHTNLALCEVCRKELAEKLLNPIINDR